MATWARVRPGVGGGRGMGAGGEVLALMFCWKLTLMFAYLLALLHS